MTASVLTKPTSVVSSGTSPNSKWWKAPIIDTPLTSPSIGLSIGDSYIVGGLGGDWYSASVNDIATVALLGSPITWTFVTPEEGMCLVDISTHQILTFTGAAWEPSTAGTSLALPNTGMTRDSTASTAVHQLISYELAQGDQSVIRIPGTVAIAHGRFGNPGDAQEGKYILRTHTVNNSFTELFLDGTAGTQRLQLPDDCTWSFQIQITAHRTDILDGHAGFTAKGVIYRQNGAITTAIQGGITTDIVSRSNAQWNINILADNINGSLKITVRGENGKTIRWVAAVTTVEVTN